MSNKNLLGKCMEVLLEPLVPYTHGEEFKGLQKDIEALDVHNLNYQEVRNILRKFEREYDRFLNYLTGSIN